MREEAVGRGASRESVGSAYQNRGGAVEGSGLSRAQQGMVGELVRMLSAVDESQVPEIHGLASSLARERRAGGRSGFA